MLTLFAIAWAVLCGAVTEWLGFSKEVGAFLAGVSLAPTQFRDSISTKLASLRDFLLLFFFIDLAPGCSGPRWGLTSAPRCFYPCSCSWASP